MISNDYWLQISRDLEPHHALFYQCWQMGKPTFTDTVATAAVSFNKAGDFIEFLFNPQFWDQLTHYERLFVIGHECLHICLNHGLRTKDSKDDRKTNKTLDVVVNHMLITSFGFEKSKIRDAPKLCWVETVFGDLPDLHLIPTNQSFEYYYKIAPATPATNPHVIDDHSKMSGDWRQVIDRLNESLTPEEKQTVQGLLQKHQGPGASGWTYVDVTPTCKRKWETIIKQWSLKYMKVDLEMREQWVRLNRRFCDLGGLLILPSEMEDDLMEKDRLPVLFFLDTSGSCWSLRERFFMAAASLPTDKFEVSLYCCDDQVHETTLASKKAIGGGGTKFSVIEDYIQKTFRSKGKAYPEAVFFVTDGFSSDALRPEMPDRWYFFLTPFSTGRWIPKKSHVFSLKDYE